MSSENLLIEADMPDSLLENGIMGHSRRNWSDIPMSLAAFDGLMHSAKIFQNRINYTLTSCNIKTTVR